MYKLSFILVGLLIITNLPAQDVQQLRETARSFQKQGDYDNAILVLNKAAGIEPLNPDVQKELGLVYYVSRQYQKAIEVMKPLADRADADEQTFQVTALIYRGQQNFKEADRTYKAALKKFPKSGMLYAEYGDLLESKDPGLSKGIQLWEKGIEIDPEYPNNYYYATKYYLNSATDMWGLLYGEIFVNLESFTGRTTEIKHLLLEGYKKIYAFGLLTAKGKSPFEDGMLETLRKQTSLTGNGITTEILTAMRTRFVLDWNTTMSKKYPFKLFELHRQLLQEGLFDSYNQWLFGSVENISIYQAWTTAHSTEYAAFNKYQRNRLFKVPEGQYYNK
ncbi:MAG: tetratricopeptide repeat protein [Bacteroidota bacterium]